MQSMRFLDQVKNLKQIKVLHQADSFFLDARNGYWLQFYIFNDLLNLFLRKGNNALAASLTKAYYSGNWLSILPKQKLHAN